MRTRTLVELTPKQMRYTFVYLASVRRNRPSTASAHSAFGRLRPRSYRNRLLETVLALCGRSRSSTHKVSSSSDRLGTVGSELALRTGCQDEYDQCVMTGSPRVLILHSV